jgi:hypothetical protein
MDQRAKKILFSAYWGAGGWRSRSEERISAAELQYAKDAGVMFDPQIVDHDALILRCQSLRDRIAPERVADAFVYSLGTRDMAYRSAIGSYAVLRHLPVHSWLGPQITCGVCGTYRSRAGEAEDLNVLNFERLKWGGVRHSFPIYAAFDLEQFEKLEAPDLQDSHVRVLIELLAAIEGTPAATSSATIQSYLPKSLKSNKAERDILIRILGLCGILDTRDHEGFGFAFTPADRRELPSRRFVDMAYPACWWTRASGVNQRALKLWFGHLL